MTSTTATAHASRSGPPGRRGLARRSWVAGAGLALALVPVAGSAAQAATVPAGDLPGVAVVATASGDAPTAIRVAGMAAVRQDRVAIPLSADHPLTPPDVVGPDGRHTRASLGPLPGGSMDVVVVLDPARAPGAGAGLAAAASGAGDFVTALPSGARVAAVVPTGSVVPAPRLATDRSQVVSTLTSATPVTRSFVGAGVNAALLTLSEAAPGHRRVLLVATDSTAGPAPELAAALRRLGVSLVVVTDVAQPQLAPIAAASGGRVIAVPSDRGVASALAGVRADLAETVSAGFEVAGSGTYRLVWPGVPGTEPARPVMPTVSVEVPQSALAAAAGALSKPVDVFADWTLLDVAVIVGMALLALVVMLAGTAALGYGRRPRPSV